MTFLNPWGLLALLGIPLILVIHMLQRNSKKVPGSTLFLLDAVEPLSRSGSRIEKLKSSLLMWAQILSILLLTWLLVKPQWIKPDSIFKAVVICDASLSMNSFKKEAVEALQKKLQQMSQGAARMEITLLSSSPEDAAIYNGPDIVQAVDHFQKWPHRHPHHDVYPALQLASNINEGKSLVILLSDHKQEVPDGVRQLLVGSSKANVGFAGVEVNKNSWKVILKNYSATAQSVKWQVLDENEQHINTFEVPLQAGENRTLEGKFIEAQQKMTLLLEDDIFPTDNKLCLIRPAKKQLNLAINLASKKHRDFFNSFITHVGDISLVDSARADLHCRHK